MVAEKWLKNLWRQQTLTYSNDEALVEQLWKEIATEYQRPGRHYHNLVHIKSVVTDLEYCRAWISNYDPIFFAAVYHDIVYEPGADNNEQKSAEFAIERLKKLSVDEGIRKEVATCILETKSHGLSEIQDCNYLRDADLAILGKPPRAYNRYRDLIRREYAAVPEVAYRAGRRAILGAIAKNERIYITSYFFEKYEIQARRNIDKELKEFAAHS